MLLLKVIITASATISLVVLLVLEFASDGFSHVVAHRLHLVLHVGLHWVLLHLRDQHTTPHKVEVQKLEILRCRFGVNLLEKVVDLLIGLVSAPLDIVVQLHFLEKNFVFVESLGITAAESESYLVTQV